MKHVLGLCVLGGLTLSAFATTNLNQVSSTVPASSVQATEMARDKVDHDKNDRDKDKDKNKGNDKDRKPTYYASEKQPGDDRGKDAKDNDEHHRGRGGKKPSDDGRRHS